jgi:hypothetical protein
MGMDLDALDRLLSAARERTGHSAFVVVGSLAILGILRQRTIPDDAAVSKYARGDIRDREWLRAGLAAGLLSIPVIDSRFRQTTFFDAAESRHARVQLEADEVWLAEGDSA